MDWTAPIQSFSLSRLEPLGDEAMGIALTCLSSWGRAMREISIRDLRINIRDEMWKQMRLGLEAVKSLDADMRFSRRDGEIQFVVGHKPGDMLTVGESTSAATAIAKELLNLADLKILHGQDPSVAGELAELLELGPIAEHLMADWATQRKGRALWRAARHRQGQPPGAAPGQAPELHVHQPGPRRRSLEVRRKNDRNELTMTVIVWILALSLGALLTVPLALVLFVTTLATPAVAANTCTPPASVAGLPQPGSPRQASLHNPPTEIPAAVRALYEAAANRFGLPWTLLAGVGMEETNHGRNNATSSAGARGLMQFMPATFSYYGVDGNGDGRAVITDDADSVHSAANYLVASGALTGPDGVRKALFADNHALWYVNDILYYAAAYSGGDVAENPCVTDDTDTTGTPLTGTGPATDAVNAALPPDRHPEYRRARATPRADPQPGPAADPAARRTRSSPGSTAPGSCCTPTPR